MVLRSKDVIQTQCYSHCYRPDHGRHSPSHQRLGRASQPTSPPSIPPPPVLLYSHQRGCEVWTAPPTEATGRGRAGPPCRLSKRRPLRRLDSPTPAALAPPGDGGDGGGGGAARGRRAGAGALAVATRWAQSLGVWGVFVRGDRIGSKSLWAPVGCEFFFLSVRFFPNSWTVCPAI